MSQHSLTIHTPEGDLTVHDSRRIPIRRLTRDFPDFLDRVREAFRLPGEEGLTTIGIPQGGTGTEYDATTPRNVSKYTGHAILICGLIEEDGAFNAYAHETPIRFTATSLWD